ncbi:hypothetical protein ACFV3E_36745 [Streptomyces sp. NPDC059718]
MNCSTNAMAGHVEGLYRRYSARLAAHSATLLSDAGLDLALVDEVTQEVWVQALEQPRLPDWDDLAVKAKRVIFDITPEGDRPEVPQGLRIVGAPVGPLYKDLPESVLCAGETRSGKSPVQQLLSV